MASKDSASSPDLIVGSVITFRSRTAGEFFGEFNKGTVYFFNPEHASFGIEDVSRTRLLVGNIPVEGHHQFNLKDVKDIKVIRMPPPKPTTNTTQDDQKTTTPSEASSSSSSTSK